MKRYKLIKEYPGSPKLGTIKESSSPEFTGFPEFWEKVVEKDYEILSFYFHGGIYKKTGETEKHYLTGKIENIFRIDKTKDGILTDGNLENKKFDKNFYIYSVKRLSDGEIFTVGDTIETCISDSCCFIYSFNVIENKLVIDHTHSYLLNKKLPGTAPNHHLYLISKAEKPLFTTEDDADIYPGMSVYCVSKEYSYEGFINSVDNSLVQSIKKSMSIGYKYFSTKEAAEEYILINKPCLSISDIKPILNHTQLQLLINEVKFKL